MPWPWILFGGVLLVLMSSATKRALAYVGGQPVEIDLRGIGGRHALRADAAASFLSMRATAAAQGVQLIVNESFRSMGEQRYFYDVYLGGGALAAKPGYSNHQGGIALDIDLVDENGKARPAAAWLEAYAHKYGWKRTIQSEPWHWEYRP